MSLYGMMRTGVSGMQGQASKLSTVADNIANADTVGYKGFSVEFSTLVVNGAAGSYNSGGVVPEVRQSVTHKGVLEYTNSTNDLAIDGGGFFIVQDSEGNSFLTRAGSFVPDSEGRLVNAAGYYLVGYSYENGEPAAVANSYAGLEAIKVSSTDLEANPSTEAIFSSYLPKSADAVTGDLPSANLATSETTAKSSIVAYDFLGDEVLLDVYYTKTADNEWEVTIYNQADATPGTSFPYAAGPLATETLTFDPTTGDLDALSPTALTVNVPGGAAMNVDVSGMSQLATDFLVAEADVNGNAPANIESVDISGDGIVYAQFSDGTTQQLYRIAVASVASPDRLMSLTGNVFQTTEESGEVKIGFANSGANGKIVSGAVESSNVDVAEELTDMIQAQRSYSANSKVFQTGSELMDVLLNLAR